MLLSLCPPQMLPRKLWSKSACDLALAINIFGRFCREKILGILMEEGHTKVGVALGVAC